MDDIVQLLLLIADGVAAGLCPVADIGLGRGWCLLGGIAEGGQGPEALPPLAWSLDSPLAWSSCSAALAWSSCSSLKLSQLSPLLSQLLKLLLCGSQVIPPGHLLRS